MRIAVTGAAGQVGYALLYRLASGEVFGKRTPITLQLLELESALPALEGVVMELEDCAFPTLAGVLATADPKQAFDGVSWALLVAAVPRRQGQERGDLLAVNARIFKPLGEALNAKAAGDVRALVVGNHCNTNAYVAHRNAPDIPADRWFAMTALDHNRAKSALAAKAGASVGEVSHMAIWGNHSSTMYPDYRNAVIGDRPAAEVIADDAWLADEFTPMVQNRGAAIIKARGQSSAASAANAHHRLGARDPGRNGRRLDVAGGRERGPVRRARGPALQLPGHLGRTLAPRRRERAARSRGAGDPQDDDR